MATEKRYCATKAAYIRLTKDDPRERAYGWETMKFPCYAEYYRFDYHSCGTWYLRAAKKDERLKELEANVKKAKMALEKAKKALAAYNKKAGIQPKPKREPLTAYSLYYAR